MGCNTNKQKDLPLSGYKFPTDNLSVSTAKRRDMPNCQKCQTRVLCSREFVTRTSEEYAEVATPEQRTNGEEAPPADCQTWMQGMTRGEKVWTSQRVHVAVREASRETPKRILTHLTRSLESRLGSEYEEERVKAADMLTVIAGNRASIILYITLVSDFIHAPAEEQRRFRGAIAWSKRGFPEAPATHSQLSYLRRLGYAGKTPVSRADAAKVIAAALKPQTVTTGGVP